MVKEDLFEGVTGGLTMQLDQRRGVLYLHNAEGRTVLRVCRIPKDVVQMIPVRRGEIRLVTDRDAKSIEVETSDNEPLLDILDVPDSKFAQSGFIDITVGYDPVRLVGSGSGM